jgi:Hypothetical glycosyl hydrolase family 15
MSHRLRHALGVSLLVSAVACVSATGAHAETAADPGKVKYRIDAGPYFSAYDREQAWITSHLAMIKAYPPFGDVYLKTGLSVLGYHDAATEGFAPLAPASIASYVGKVSRDASVGYAGTFLDDINWSPAYRDGSQSGAPEPEMERLAELVEAVRTAIPTGTIEMNSQYHDIYPLYKAGNADVLRALSKINLLCKEFGVGPTAGINTLGDYDNFLAFADELRAKGVHITMTGDQNSPTAETMEYNEATYLLINDGHDYINGTQQTPINWWPGFNADLGEASGARYVWNGLIRRDFAHGTALVNPPGTATTSVALPSPMEEGGGATVSSVTLAGASGVVLVGRRPGAATRVGARGGPQRTQTTLRTYPVIGSAASVHHRATGGGKPARHRAAGARPRTTSTSQRRRAGDHHGRSRGRRPSGLTRVLGSVLHAGSGLVVVKVQARRHRRWVPAKSLRLRFAANGTFAGLVKLKAGGVYRLVALYLGTPSYAPSRSSYRLLVLRAR